MKRILVTGGLGYIGSNACVGLHEAGYTPVVLDNRSSANPNNWKGIEELIGEPLTVLTKDVSLLSSDALTTILDWHEIVGVIHLAGEKRLRYSRGHALDCYSNNVNGLMRLLEGIDGCKRSIPLVFASSASVGMNPPSPYSRSKGMGEQILTDWIANGGKGFSVRIHNPIGTHESGRIGRNHYNDLITASIKAIRTGEDFVLNKGDYDTVDGSPLLEWVGIEQVVNVLVKGIGRCIDGYPLAGVHPVGGGTRYTVIESVERMNRIAIQEGLVAQGNRVKIRIETPAGYPGDIIATPNSNWASIYRILGIDETDTNIDALMRTELLFWV